MTDSRGNSGPSLATGVFFGASQPLLNVDGLELTWSVYQPRQEMGWHTHEVATLYLHVCGEHTDICESTEFEQAPLSVSLHPRGIAHRSRIGRERMAGLNVSLTGAWIERCGLAETQIGRFTVQDHPLLCRAALSLLLRATAPEAASFSHAEPSTANRDEIESQTLEILSFFGPAPIAESAPPRWLRQAEARLRDTYREPIRLAQIAADAHVHPVHLSRTFRARHHCTVMEFVHLLRLHEATRLMLHKTPAAVAAREAGFADQAHLIRSFRRHLGVSPKSLKPLAALTPLPLPSTAV